MNRFKLFKAICLAAILAFCGISTMAATFTVTTISDNAGGTNPSAGAGTGTLRQAIIDANNTAASDEIVFDIAGAGVKTLVLNALLPVITRPVHIRGYSQGIAGPIGSRTILIEINGSKVTTGGGRGSGASADGLFRFTTNADGSSISGLSIFNTGSNIEAIMIEPGVDGMHIWGNYIGVRADGKSPVSSSQYNGDDGILLGAYNITSGSISNVFIGTDGNGTDDANEGNVIANSADPTDGGDGIQVGTNTGTYTWSNIRISGNYIGVEADGLTSAGNGISKPGAVPGLGADGILIYRASNVLIGSNGDATSDNLEKNIISGNYTNGIDVIGGSSINIGGNYIGTDLSATKAIPNGLNSSATVAYAGILVATNSSSVVVGFNDAVHGAGVANNVRNIVSGNYGVGVQFYNNTATTNRISGNYVGVDVTGNKALGNGQANKAGDASNIVYTVGIDVAAQPSLLVGTDGDGDDDVLEGNIVSGNFGTGIYVRSGSNSTIVAGNYVGVGVDGTTAIGNDYVGVRLNEVSTTRIGSNDDGVSDAIEANIIANNAHATYFTTNDGIRITGSSSIRNRLSRNIYYNNAENAIDLSNDGVTVNDGVTTASNPNILIDYPVITSYSVSGNVVTVSGYVGRCNGSENTAGTTISGTLTVQLYKTADDGDQNGAISTNGCTRVVTHGEGGQYLGSITVTGGVFTNQTFTIASGASFTAADLITGITIDANGNTSEFGVLTYIKISGKVWNDADGSVTNNGSETGTNASGLLYVNLVDAAGTVIGSALVDANGDYSIDGPPSRTGLKLVLVTSATANTPGTLPAGWVNTGENVGPDNTASQSSTLSQIELTTGTTDVTNQNFGIEQRPIAGNGSNTAVNSPGQIPVPLNTFTNGSNSTDATPGDVASIIITAIPAGASSININGTLYGAGGIPFPAAGVTLSTDVNGLPIGAAITVDPTADGVTVVTIPFVAVDNAGVQSVNTGIEGTAVLNLTAAPITISGAVWNDANGTAIKDGSEPFTNAGGLFANLVTPAGVVLQSVAVDPTTGQYEFSNVPANTSYNVILTEVAQTGVTNLTASDLPSDWVNTGVNLDGTPSTGNTTGVITVNAGIVSVTNQNFGIEQTPTADAVTLTNVPNSTFSTTPQTSYPVLSNQQSAPLNHTELKPLSGNDPEDCPSTKCSSGSTFLIESIKTSNTALYYDFGGSIGIAEVVPGTSTATITNFDPAKLVIYGTVGSGSSTDPFEFTYRLVDVAGVASAPVLYTVSTSSSLPVTLATFTAKRGEGITARLDWTTTAETNSDFFEVQQSNDGKSWKALSEVRSHGDSKELNNYNYTHTTPSAGINYYRLKMVDLDGTFAHSRIQSIDFGKTTVSVVLYPNPVSEVLQIKDLAYDSISEVLILNTQGQVVYKSTSISPKGINVRGLFDGIYMVKVVLKDGTESTARIAISN